MSWNAFAGNWNDTLRTLLRRFPHADQGQLTQSKAEPDAVARHVAQTHDLTEFEAREELQDWMFVQGLAREAADLRSHDADFISAD